MSEIQFHYFDFAHAVMTHTLVIEKSGGLKGIKDKGQIESILHQVQSDYYPEFIDKLTYLIFSFNKFHCFNDGNKRASLALSSYFLEINGHDRSILAYTAGMEEVAIWLACSLINEIQLKKIVSYLLFETDQLGQLYFIEVARSLRRPVEIGIMPRELMGRILEELVSKSDGLSETVQLELLDVFVQIPEQEDN